VSPVQESKPGEVKQRVMELVSKSLVLAEIQGKELARKLGLAVGVSRELEWLRVRE
jgi:hypothetical protein